MKGVSPRPGGTGKTRYYYMSMKRAFRLPLRTKHSMRLFFGVLLPSCLAAAVFTGCFPRGRSEQEACMYYYGVQQYKLAIDPLTKAMKNELFEMQYYLAKCYLEGLGVGKDEGKAFDLLQGISPVDQVSAKTELGKCYLNGIGTAKAPEMAVQCFREAEAAGDGEAAYLLSLCLEKGEGVAQDETGAKTFLRKAAKQGHPAAQFHLAELYFNGTGITRDAVRAAGWCREAAINDLPEAQFNLAACYENGEGVEKDLEQAVRWYGKAADWGDADALAALDRLGAK